MDFLQLEYFLAVARIGSMTAAASQLHIAQSSISRCIARLEADLGVPLFNRSGSRITLSEYGKAFYPRAEAILLQLRDGKQELAQLCSQHTGQISIATNASRQINDLMIRQLSEYPDTRLRQQRISNIDQIKSKLRSGELDFALTSTVVLDPDFEWKPLLSERYYALVSHTHPYAQLKHIPLSSLAEDHLLINESDDPDHIAAQLQAIGKKPVFAFVGNEYEVLGPLVERGIGVALISSLGLSDMRTAVPLERLSKIRTVPIQNPPLQRTLGLLSLKHHYRSPEADAFYRMIITYFKTLEAKLN